MKSKPRIIISGGGIGGLTAALSLIDRGIDTLVLEQASSLKALGAGLQLSANATRVLHGLGLADELAKVTIKPTAKCIRLWNTGQQWELFDLGNESLQRYGHPYMMLYRPDLHDVLYAALKERSPQSIRLNAKVVDVGQTGEGVYVALEDGTSGWKPMPLLCRWRPFDPRTSHQKGQPKILGVHGMARSHSDR